MGRIAAVRDALSYNSSIGMLSLDGTQIAEIQRPAGGFDVNSNVDIL
ncbi:MAG: hypothetical protein ACFB0D_09910 [Phormidesmis sp.]